ncbi:MAG: DegT/DnrJ/EryC1/StrS family aminotransferase [Bacteroidales bacterium]|nr:DegT/DnrJ/EryC1/StrS family aminotransferase [Bacteroidales bacterium]MBN2756810.1 DegT/DnrJ/EryC1/StrS family aminotransferase [Bacteroidales bacterium]
MKIPFVDLKSQYNSIKKEIDSAIQSVIERTAFIKGEEIEQFEKAYAEKYGVKNCIAVANGTDAIYIALKMLGIKEGDEVITVANSWISTAETISQTGATPVFIDIDKYSTIDISKIEEKITKNTKAIIPVHIYGQSADIKAIKKISDKHNLFLIEDCAQSHFAEFEGQRVGTFGDLATFSFYPGKNLGAYGDAGAIVTNNDELANKMRMYANHGALKKHQHKIVGINSRMDTLQAAILKVKLPHIDSWNAKRAGNAEYYDKILANIGDIIVPPKRENAKHVYHVYSIRTKFRDELMNYLENNNIGVAIHYPVALPLMEAYSHLNYKNSDIPIASEYQDQILSLPMYPELTKEMMDYVAETIKQFFNTK